MSLFSAWPGSGGRGGGARPGGPGPAGEQGAEAGRVQCCGSAGCFSLVDALLNPSAQTPTQTHVTQGNRGSFGLDVCFFRLRRSLSGWSLALSSCWGMDRRCEESWKQYL